MENTDNKLTKSYTNLGCGSFLSNHEIIGTTIIHSFDMLAWPTKGRIFAIDAISKFAPKGFITWMMEKDRGPAAARLRENRTYVHEVAAKLIEDKKEELKNGTLGKDVLSTIGPSRVASVKLYTWVNVQFSSQGQFCFATRLAIDR